MTFENSFQERMASVTVARTSTKKNFKHCPQIDTSQARSNLEVLRKSIRELGWKECPTYSSTRSNIFWHAATFQDGNRNFASTSARVNKFPGMSDLMQKANLTRALNMMQRLFPDQFDFYPRTWFLPEQREQFEKDVHSIHQIDRRRKRRLTTFIVKPSDGSEGAGIYLIQDPVRCSLMNRPHVVQEYIDRPLLIDGLKFDMRIYVVILKLDPLEIYLYNEGLARFATLPYETPTGKNLHEAFMHLTNYSLNKRSSNYKHASDEQQTDASKRKMTLVWMQLRQFFNDEDIFNAKQMIKDMINKTILAFLPELRVQYAMEMPTSTKQNRCFQIIGFDVLLTNRLKPILLEVNANPSLRIDFDHVNETGKFVCEPSLIDEEIKKPLVKETLKLVMKSNRRQSEDSSSDDEDENVVQSSINSLERIFPSDYENQYEQMFLMEKIAFIYIELVIKRGYKSMTNWSFRNLVNLCKIFDSSSLTASIDILYIQLFQKFRESSTQSPAMGLTFAGFVDAFFLLSQRKFPNSTTTFESVHDLTELCLQQLNLNLDERM